ncbi:hypothetical protein [Streptomyces sp. RFCAC02]|uniref:hypothetical protein n=1 Tax=Streptomyces sp. RFCAC02 TaxID=2499143 RepID=UPI0010218656|nr:hypothetical protein [Streptomyces sp. RFCAC02]
MTSNGIVAEEALQAAWDSYRFLKKRTPAQERDQAQQRVRAAMETCGREEVARATILLIGALTGYVVNEQASVPEEDRLDPLSDLIPAVIRRLPSFRMADPGQVPMVTGVLMAAAMGMDAVAWRDQYGPIPPKESLIHGFVLWLLADLIDSLTERPGFTDELVREILSSGPPGQSE